MKFCLPKPIANNFLESIKDGSLDLEKLAAMPDSASREKYLSQFIGDAPAKEVTSLFESKLMMRDVERGMISFIKEVGNLNPKVERDLVSRVNKLLEKGALTPDDKAKFLEDFVSKKLGVETSAEDAEVIARLAREFQKAKADPNSGLNFGAAKVELYNFMNNLRLSGEKQTFGEVVDDFFKRPLGTATDQVSKLAGFAKGVKASMDNSALFRQGWRTVFTNPVIWSKNALRSFQDIARTLGKKGTDDAVLDGIKAEIWSRPNSRNGLYDSMKLDIGSPEEAYPTTLPSKIPIFGRLYNASQTAYTGFLYRMRADIADKLAQRAAESGLDLNVKLQSESIGKLVNSLTGRGSLGSYEKVGKNINTIFFSPKLLKSHLDFLTLHSMDEMSGFARKEAGKNLLKVFVGMTTVLGIAEALHPGSVELDPRSADFGKIKIGDTRFDVSGGMGSVMTLAARTLPALIGKENYTKSSTTRKLTQLNTGKFGSRNTMDVIFDFSENKLAPMASTFTHLLNKRDFEGEKVTLAGEAMNLIVPLNIENAWETMQNPDSAPLAATLIADFLGISTNTYDRRK